jgi:methionyl aminopeptidase
MIVIKNKVAIRKMEDAGRQLALLFQELADKVVVGVTTLALEEWIVAALKNKGLKSRTIGYMGYRYASCISINDELVHGIPSKNRILVDGDLVKIDVCASLDDYCADMARSFFVGKPSAQAQRLVNVAQQALEKAIAAARAGNRLGDVSYAIQSEVERHGFGVVRDFAGHGIGKHMHEDPEILNYGEQGQGPVLRAGMTLALEPMITERDYTVTVTDDGWTVKTLDGGLTAHVEDTVLVTDAEPLVLTRLSNENRLNRVPVL